MSVVSSVSSQKTAAVESEVSDRSDENHWAEWRRNQPTSYHHPFTVGPRYPVAAYFPQGNHPAAPPIMHHHLASDSTIQRTRFSFSALPHWNLCVHGSSGRASHIKGTVCVVLAIALIFIIVLILGLVSNKQDH
ncbi:hypothetical protein GQX73_g9259 [Xylaria multiplex]|uniref:Uncharacterized protein n=1 Tax=Xylaria multiplex TaxID=323545 RepID=A0A7C8IR00_9PEZI|nr:hypothetical protein GQX73_g9259 [Xylaria multiplex]